MNGLTRAVHGAVVGGWLGASLLVAAIVAPHAFVAFPTRAEAGDYVGGVLRVIDSWAIAAALVAGGAVLMGGRARGARTGAAVLLALAGIASLALGAKLAAMRVALGPIDRLAVDDPGRRQFGMLHGVSMLILLVGMLSAAASLVLEGMRGPRSGAEGA